MTVTSPRDKTDPFQRGLFRGGDSMRRRTKPWAQPDWTSPGLGKSEPGRAVPSRGASKESHRGRGEVGEPRRRPWGGARVGNTGRGARRGHLEVPWPPLELGGLPLPHWSVAGRSGFTLDPWSTASPVARTPRGPGLPGSPSPLSSLSSRSPKAVTVPPALGPPLSHVLLLVAVVPGV